MNFRSSVNTGNEGLFWLNQVRSWDSKVQIIMITAYTDIDLDIIYLKEGEKGTDLW